MSGALGLAQAVWPLVAVLLAAMLAWRALRNPLRLRLMRARGEHFVVAGDSALARLATLNELGQGNGVLLWREGAERGHWAAEALSRGAAAVHASEGGRSAALLGLDKARGALLLAQDDAENAGLAVEVMEQAARARPAGDPLEVIARIDDPALHAPIEEHGDRLGRATARIRLASLPALAARQLFLARPLDGFRRAGAAGRGVFVFGFTRTVEHYVLRMLAGAHFRDGGKPRFTVIDARGSDLGRDFAERHPGADALSPVRFEEAAAGLAGFAAFYAGLIARHGEPAAVIVDAGEDAATLALAGAVDAFYREARATTPNIHVRLDVAASATAGPTVHGFGRLEDFAGPEVLVQVTHDALARSIHDFYLEGRLAEGDRIDSRGSMHEWEDLAEHFREDNRLVADCYQIKLRDIGALLVDGSGPPLRLEPDELEELSRAEHDRWMAAKLADGWVYGPVRDDGRRIHPDIVPYDALSERIKDLDREQVRAMTRLLAGAGKRAMRVLAVGLEPGSGVELAGGLPAVLGELAARYPDRVPVLVGALADPASRQAMAAAAQPLRLVVQGHVEDALAGLEGEPREAALAMVRCADVIVGMTASGDARGQVHAAAELLVATGPVAEAPCPVIRLGAGGTIEAAPWLR